MQVGRISQSFSSKLTADRCGMNRFVRAGGEQALGHALKKTMLESVNE